MIWLKIWLGCSFGLFIWATGIIRNGFTPEPFGWAVLVYIIICYNTIQAVDKSRE